MLRIAEATGLEYPDRDNWDIFYQFMLPSMWDFQPYGAAPDDPHRELDELVAFSRRWKPDLVLWDPVFPIGAVAAAATGAAHGRLLWGLDYYAWGMDRLAERAGLPGAPEENPLVETMRPGCARYGVEVDEAMLVGQFTVDPMPAGMRLPASTRTLPYRWVPYAGQTPIPEWLYQGSDRPRVALSLGLSQRLFFKDGWDHVPKLLEMVSTLDVEVVATLNADQLALVPRLPDNVRAVDYVPLNQLLPTCRALVHQGGLGTFAAASAAAVPQLIIDFETMNGTHEVDGGLATEKHTEAALTAGYVTRRGAGLPLDITLSVDTMRKQLERVLDEPSFQQGADGVCADTLAAPSPNEIVPVLETLAARFRA